MKKRQPDLIERVVIGIFSGLWFLISWPIKKILKLKTQNEKLDKVANLQKWLQIEKMLESDDEIHTKQAIIEADNFFDWVMKKISFENGSFADRLKSIEYKIDKNSYQKVWQAHKVRNQISHVMDYQLSDGEAKRALENFRDGLNNLGAI